MDYLYKKFAKYYDLCYSGKDYVKETKFLEALIKKHKIKGKKILEVGSGTGNHAVHLEKKGFDIIGVDLNKEMLAVARKKSKKIKFFQGDMHSFNIKGEFDIILCLFSTMHYNTNISDLKKTLKNFYKHLKKGGLLVFDMGFNQERYSAKHPSHTGSWSRGDVELVRFMKSRRVKNHALIHGAYILFKDNKFYFGAETHTLGIFKTLDVKNLAERVGFNVKVYSDYKLVPWRGSSKKYVVFSCVKY